VRVLSPRRGPSAARRHPPPIAASALAAHNYFLRNRPDLLRRLYEPFYRDHQEYQATDAASTNWRPVFAWDGQLRTRFNARHTLRGYEKTGRMLDEPGAFAVKLKEDFLGDPEHRLDLWPSRVRSRAVPPRCERLRAPARQAGSRLRARRRLAAHGVTAAPPTGRRLKAGPPAVGGDRSPGACHCRS